MRRLFQVIFPLFFLALAVLSCQEEFSRDEAAAGAKVYRTLYTCAEEAFATSIPTRVGLGEGLFPRWEASDSLSVLDGTANNVFVVSGNDGSSARFGGEVSESASTLRALYPYDGEAALVGGVISTTLPAVQTVMDSVCHRALLCTAEGPAEGGSLSFRNAYSLVKIHISLSGVNSVTLRGLDGELLAGPGSITAGSTEGFVPGENGSATVTLLPEGESFVKGANYYIAIAPTAFSAGFEITMNRIDGADAIRSTDKQLTLLRNEGVNLDDVATSLVWSNVITTKEELFTWNEGYKSWTANDEVRLGADIDMEGEEWTPHTFRGVFDGQEHRLSNFVCKSDTHLSGFFSDLYGTVKNLTIGSSDGISWDGNSIVRHEYHGNETSWPNAGSVCARLQSGGYLYRVTNFAKVEQGAADAKKRCRLGGIVAYVAQAGSLGIEACVNYGEVVNNCTSTTANQPMGGITGSAEGAVTIKSCANYGHVTSNCAGVNMIGGIMGVSNGRAAVDASGNTNYVATITDCHNAGTISSTMCSSDLFLGGIVGFLTGAQITTSSNSGSVFSTVEDKVNNIGGIAGAFNKENESFIDDCSNTGEIIGSATSARNNVGGIIGLVNSGAEATLALTSVTNEGKIHCCGSSDQSAVGGIAGRSEKAGCDVTTATNSGEIYIDGTAAGQRNIGGICGVTTGNTVYDGCVNSGNIHSASKAGPARVGGFFGHGAAFTLNCTHRQSENKGKIYGYSASNDGAMGGIAGYAQGGFNIIGTEERPVLNTGEVCADDASARVWIGGITGFTQIGNNSITWARNTGKVSKNAATKVHCILGGIMGRVQGGANIVNHCVNDGPVTNEGEGENLYWVGGIVGRAFMNSGSIQISECTNNANVSLRSTASKRTNGLVAAGILGSGNKNCTVTGNVNNGSVSIFSGNAAAHPHVAGIFGDDVDVDTGSSAPAANIITGNTNNGLVTATGTSGQARIGAGGIVGRMSFTSALSTVTGNNSNGNVSASAGGTTLFGSFNTGGSGAVVGDMQTESVAPITAAVSKNITVGGVSYGTAESIGSLQAWLCPNSSKIEATYID